MAKPAKGIDFLRALDVFAAVAEQRSLTAAAATLGITQSAVSQLLKQLEGELGQELVDRAVRPVGLTAAGVALRARAVQLLADAAQARAAVRDIARGVLPHLRIAVISSLAGTLIPPLVSALCDRLEVHRVSVWRGLATTDENALIDRDVDMLVTSDPLYNIDGLDRFELFNEPYLVALPPGEMPPDDAERSLAALGRRLPFIRYTRRTQIGWAIEGHLKRLKLDLSDRLEFDSAEDVIAMVAAGRGWAITAPSHVVQGLRAGDALDTAPLPGPGMRRGVNLVVRSGELGRLPGEVRVLCAEVLRRDFAPQLARVLPWLGDAFVVAEPG
ncbi:MAG: LysR family transcriptional regulator [Alphaproteobacteria bacterium]